MRLPNGDHAFIAPAKLAGYLLSETHPAGQSKAKFFRAAGFDQTTLPVLQDSLLIIAKACEVTQVRTSPHGMKYIIDGSLSTPAGNVVPIRTIWIIDTGQDTPRFVTAYPQ
jgi:Domain of unknown function (DUF6883)